MSNDGGSRQLAEMVGHPLNRLSYLECVGLQYEKVIITTVGKILATHLAITTEICCAHIKVTFFDTSFEIEVFACYCFV